jgi:hypothetical protein
MRREWGSWTQQHDIRDMRHVWDNVRDMGTTTHGVSSISKLAREPPGSLAKIQNASNATRDLVTMTNRTRYFRGTDIGSVVMNVLLPFDPSSVLIGNL